jgi:hypothetical protein
MALRFHVTCRVLTEPAIEVAERVLCGLRRDEPLDREFRRKWLRDRTRRLGILVALTSQLAAIGCRDPLRAENLNDPDIPRIFAQPAAIEQALGSGYQLCRNRPYVSDVNAQMGVMALEGYSQLGNLSVGARAAIPRTPILNNKSVSHASPETFSTFSRQSRLSANALKFLDGLSESGRALALPAQELRARALGFFAIGCNLGWLAMIYDSAGIVHHRMDSEEVPPLSGYTAVMSAALANMDTAIAIARVPSAADAGGFPGPAQWFGGNALTATGFVQLVRSYKARFRAGVARTPQERAAVDWNAVIADAENGLTADVVVQVGAATGWNAVPGFQEINGFNQMGPFIWGFADVSGGYDAWIAKGLLDRTDFLIVTPDLRWPSGNTREAQTAASRRTGTYAELPYISHSSVFVGGEGWGNSHHYYSRFAYLGRTGGVGIMPEFLKSELDLLAAEGYLRTNRIAEAAAKIDLSRVGHGGLPALSGAVTDATQPVPGGANCVPRVPQPPSFSTAACGTMLEALKYEKRIELVQVSLGSWFFDARGWGDLVVGTPLEFPVPVPELDARRLPYYNLGGGGRSSALRGTYGFP